MQLFCCNGRSQIARHVAEQRAQMQILTEHGFERSPLPQLHAEEIPVPVRLNIYSLTNRNKKLVKFGLGVFHTGVEVYGIEWGYGEAMESPNASGLFYVRPGHAAGSLYKSIQIGYTTKSPVQVDTILHRLENEWRSKEYHILHHNCNHFAQAFCDALSNGTKRLTVPPWCNRAARLSDKILPKSLATKVQRLLDDEPPQPVHASSLPRHISDIPTSVIPLQWYLHPSVRQPSRQGTVMAYRVPNTTSTAVPVPGAGRRVPETESRRSHSTPSRPPVTRPPRAVADTVAVPTTAPPRKTTPPVSTNIMSSAVLQAAASPPSTPRVVASSPTVSDAAAAAMYSPLSPCSGARSPVSGSQRSPTAPHPVVAASPLREVNGVSHPMPTPGTKPISPRIPPSALSPSSPRSPTLLPTPTVTPLSPPSTPQSLVDVAVPLTVPPCSSPSPPSPSPPRHDVHVGRPTNCTRAMPQTAAPRRSASDSDLYVYGSTAVPRIELVTRHRSEPHPTRVPPPELGLTGRCVLRARTEGARSPCGSPPAEESTGFVEHFSSSSGGDVAHEQEDVGDATTPRSPPAVAPRQVERVGAMPRRACTASPPQRRLSPTQHVPVVASSLTVMPGVVLSLPLSPVPESVREVPLAGQRGAAHRTDENGSDASERSIASAP